MGVTVVDLHTTSQELPIAPGWNSKLLETAHYKLQHQMVIATGVVELLLGLGAAGALIEAGRYWQQLQYVPRCIFAAQSGHDAGRYREATVLLTKGAASTHAHARIETTTTMLHCNLAAKNGRTGVAAELP